MRFFEVKDRIIPWFTVQQKPYPRVASSRGGGEVFFCLPLGGSLKKLLIEADYEKEVRLKWGKLETVASSTSIIKQSRQQSLKDGQALVLLSTPPGAEGGRVTYTGHDESAGMPEIVDSIPVSGYGYDWYEHLLLFREDQGLIVERNGTLEGAREKLVLKWDGRFLSDGLKRRRPPRKRK
jgi:hypothetical protein